MTAITEITVYNSRAYAGEVMGCQNTSSAASNTSAEIIVY